MKKRRPLRFLNIFSKRRDKAYSIIEIIIVITLFSITSVAVTVSYISFEARERAKNSALQIKSDLRFVQSRAQNGDKIVDLPPATDGSGTGGCRSPEDFLAGWYITLRKGATVNTSYELTGNCMFEGFKEKRFGYQSIKLPKDVQISDLQVDGVSVGEVSVFFRVLKYEVSFHDSNVMQLGPPDATDSEFFDSSGNLYHQIPSDAAPGKLLVIFFTSPDSSYKLQISKSGKIEEVKP